MSSYLTSLGFSLYSKVIASGFITLSSKGMNWFARNTGNNNIVIASYSLVYIVRM